MRGIRAMRIMRGICTAAVGLAALGGDAASAQHYVLGGEPAEGKVTVWIVHPTSTVAGARPMGRGLAPMIPGQVPADPSTHHEQTSGSFGQSAGSVGQTAGTGGTTMGEFGQPAGSTGQTAGTYGQTAGSYGGSVTSRNAGDVGRTMGSFGVSTSDLGRAAAAAATPRTRWTTPERQTLWVDFATRTQGRPGIFVVYVDVLERELVARLEAVAKTEDAPDVLLGSPLPGAWALANLDATGGPAVHLLWAAQIPVRRSIVQTEYEGSGRAFLPQYSILASAPHPAGARRYVLSMLGGVETSPLAEERVPREAAAFVARRSFAQVLAGAGVGADADKEIATFDTEQVAAAGLRRYGDPEPKPDVETVWVEELGGLAVAGLQATVSTDRLFGLVRAFEVLRRDAAGRWRVLQVTPMSTAGMTSVARGQVELLREASRPNEGTEVLGVSAAAPLDGDNRPPAPELWWDNHGGASLQVVEWQRRLSDEGEADGWTPSNLFFVPDSYSRLRTEVTARFFDQQGCYRWRIWSVGRSGTTVLSPWRELTIVPR